MDGPKMAFSLSSGRGQAVPLSRKVLIFVVGNSAFWYILGTFHDLKRFNYDTT